MNYRELLKKYIELVGMKEGTDFLSVYDEFAVYEPHHLSRAEWEELRTLSAESSKERQEYKTCNKVVKSQ